MTSLNIHMTKHKTIITNLSLKNSHDYCQKQRYKFPLNQCNYYKKSIFYILKPITICTEQKDCCHFSFPEAIDRPLVSISYVALTTKLTD